MKESCRIEEEQTTIMIYLIRRMVSEVTHVITIEFMNDKVTMKSNLPIDLLFFFPDFDDF